jgi:hypothetical protein
MIKFATPDPSRPVGAGHDLAPGQANGRIGWIVDWKRCASPYRPADRGAAGWPQAGWGSVEDWANRIHPEERERVVEERVAQALAGTDHQCTYRLLKADGGWLRVADKARVVRKINGDVDCLTGTMTVTGEVKPRPRHLFGSTRLSSTAISAAGNTPEVSRMRGVSGR